MEFLSIPFSICLILTFVLYYAHVQRQWQRGVLLVSSAVFIGYYDIVYLLYTLGITLFTFYYGRFLARMQARGSAGYVLSGGIVALVGTWLAARYCSSAFPLGISFYTFQAIAYLIDIYWEEEPEESLPDFCLYMMLFMKFLSGPIERSYDLLPQLKQSHAFNYTKVVDGMKLLLWGAFMKLVIADRLATPLDSVFADVHSASGMQLLEATLIYPIQLYADFSGYTNMALGLAAMFGFKLSPNFNRPFAALSTGDLWRRWHMSLSFWVRDYVFVPLSASLRKWGMWGVSVSLLVTFAVIGVWHGAGWTFAIYGLIQGAVIIYETVCARQRDRMKARTQRHLYAFVMILRTYLLFALSLLFFRLETVGEVIYTYAHLLDGMDTNVKELNLGMKDFYWIVVAIATTLMLTVEYIHSRINLLERTTQWHTLWRWTAYFAFAFIIFLLGAFGVENFIYIQF